MIDKPLVTRYEGNPILTKHDIPYAVETVHNAGATKNDGQYILLFRSHLRNGPSAESPRPADPKKAGLGTAAK